MGYDIIPQNCNFALICAYTGRVEEGFEAIEEIEKQVREGLGTESEEYCQIVLMKAVLYACGDGMMSAISLGEKYIESVKKECRNNYAMQVNELLTRCIALKWKREQ